MSPPEPAAPPRAAAWHYWLPVAGWVVVMLYFSSAPNPVGELPGPPTMIDLGGHIFGFLVLMPLMARWVRHRAGHAGTRPLLIAALACAAYALLDELHQIPIPGRSFEWIDLVADGSGILLGAAGSWRPPVGSDIPQ